MDPNFSFDLCRLACSMFDYFITDLSICDHADQQEPHIKMILEWCTDDNGRNILYKHDGSERYPDFKLYKMISRGVHKHTPANQLTRMEFDAFRTNVVDTHHISADIIIDVDDIPQYYKVSSSLQCSSV